MLNKKRLITRLSAFIILIGSVLSVMLFNITFITTDVNKGIEFQGGLEVVLEISNDTQEIKAEDMNSIAGIIAKRIDAVGVKNPIVDIEEGTDPETNEIVNRIRVTLAGVTQKSEQQKMIETLTARGEVSFRDIQDTHLDKDTTLISGARLAYDDSTNQPIVELKVKDTEKMAQITRDIAAKGEGSNLMVIWIDYDALKADLGGNLYDQWKNISEDCKYEYKITNDDMRRLCNSVISAATVSQELSTDRVTISGNFTTEEARELAAFINAGSIDYDIELVETSYVEGAFGAAAFDKAITAAIIALVAVAAFMIVIYGIGGLIAAIVLAIFAFATIATFNWLGGEYAPDTIAALVIGLGMAIDATIIMLERLKDEVRKGRTLSRSIDESSKKSLSSIVDANITTFIAAFVLFQFGSRTVKGFSIMLTISIFWTVILMVFLARILISQIIKTGLFENKKHLFGIRKDTIGYTDNLGVVHTGIKKSMWANVNFIRNAKKFIVGSAAIITVGIAVAGFVGPNQSIQFTGGARIDIVTSIELAKGEDITSKQEQVDEQILKIEEYILEKTKITINERVVGINIDDPVNDPDLRRVVFSFKTKNQVEPSTWVDIKKELEDDNVFVNPEDGENLVYKFTGNAISSNLAKDTVANAFSSLWWAAAAIVVYVTIRFKWTYALSAIIALIHDALIVFAIFTIFQVEISLPFVSAILAIIGYSINDTIVSFDRIRDGVKSTNKHRLNKEELKTVANEAIRATATRSLFTTITTLLAVVSLLAFGPGATFTFNLAMLIGLIAGTYSSIFIAAQVWIQLENFRQKRMKDKKEKVVKVTGPDEHIFTGIND